MFKCPLLWNLYLGQRGATFTRDGNVHIHLRRECTHSLKTEMYPFTQDGIYTIHIRRNVLKPLETNPSGIHIHGEIVIHFYCEVNDSWSKKGEADKWIQQTNKWMMIDWSPHARKALDKPLAALQAIQFRLLKQTSSICKSKQSHHPNPCIAVDSSNTTSTTQDPCSRFRSSSTRTADTSLVSLSSWKTRDCYLSGSKNRGNRLNVDLKWKAEGIRQSGGWLQGIERSIIWPEGAM